MGSVYLYAGNYMTGNVLRADVPNDEQSICSVLEGFIKSLGMEYLVWELYNKAQSMEVREIQFNNRLVRAREEHAEFAA